MKALVLLLLASSLHGQDLSQARLRMNPEGWTPLSGLLILNETNRFPLTVTVKGKNPKGDIAYTYPTGWGTDFPVHGFYAGHNNTLTVEMNGRRGSFPVVTEASVPRLSFPITVQADNLPPEGEFDKDLYFISIPLQGALLAIDRMGDVRYLNKKQVFSIPHLEPSPQGMVYYDALANGDFVKNDLLGRELFRKNGEGIHHEVMTIGGNYVVLSSSDWGWDDTVTEITPEGETVAKKFLGDALRKAVDPSDLPLLHRVVYDDRNIYQRGGTNVRSDWAHINGYTFDYGKGLIILSVRSHGVFALDYEKWELAWWFADDRLDITRGFGYGFSSPGSIRLFDVPSLQKYRLKGAQNIGPLTQHAPLLKANGNLLIFDNNGDFIGKKNPEGSRAAEYKIENGAISLVREFVHPEKIYSRLTSDVDLTGQNRENWLLLFSEAYPNRLTEVGPRGEILFDVSFDTKQLFWRADRMPLYPYMDPAKKYSIDKNEAFGL